MEREPATETGGGALTGKARNLEGDEVLSK